MAPPSSTPTPMAPCMAPWIGRTSYLPTCGCAPPCQRMRHAPKPQPPWQWQARCSTPFLTHKSCFRAAGTAAAIGSYMHAPSAAHHFNAAPRPSLDRHAATDTYMHSKSRAAGLGWPPAAAAAWLLLGLRQPPRPCPGCTQRLPRWLPWRPPPSPPSLSLSLRCPGSWPP